MADRPQNETNSAYTVNEDDLKGQAYRMNAILQSINLRLSQVESGIAPLVKATGGTALGGTGSGSGSGVGAGATGGSVGTGVGVIYPPDTGPPDAPLFSVRLSPDNPLYIEMYNVDLGSKNRLGIHLVTFLIAIIGEADQVLPTSFPLVPNKPLDLTGWTVRLYLAGKKITSVSGCSTNRLANSLWHVEMGPWVPGTATGSLVDDLGNPVYTNPGIVDVRAGQTVTIYHGQTDFILDHIPVRAPTVRVTKLDQGPVEERPSSAAWTWAPGSPLVQSAVPVVGDVQIEYVYNDTTTGEPITATVKI